MGLIILVVVVVLIVIWGVGMYNGLIRSQENIRNAMSQIAAQVESRWDALTNLISAAKKYQNYESETFTKIVQARSQVSSRSSVSEVDQDEQKFAQATGMINALAEQYPDLKTSQVYEKTMDSVNQYENQVRHSRMIYNDTVTRYNRTIKTFPNLIIARLLGFDEEIYFENTESKKEMPQW